MIIGIHSKHRHLAKLVARCIQIKDLKERMKIDKEIPPESWESIYAYHYSFYRDGWRIKEFDHLNKMVLHEMTGQPMENLNDEEFIKQELPTRWKTNFIKTWKQAIQRLKMLMIDFNEQGLLAALMKDYKANHNWIIIDANSRERIKTIKEYDNGYVLHVEDGSNYREGLFHGSVDPTDSSTKLQHQVEKFLNKYEIRHS